MALILLGRRSELGTGSQLPYWAMLYGVTQAPALVEQGRTREAADTIAYSVVQARHNGDHLTAGRGLLLLSTMARGSLERERVIGLVKGFGEMARLRGLLSRPDWRVGSADTARGAVFDGLTVLAELGAAEAA